MAKIKGYVSVARDDIAIFPGPGRCPKGLEYCLRRGFGDGEIDCHYFGCVETVDYEVEIECSASQHDNLER